MRQFVRILLTAGVALALGQSAFAQRGGAQPGGGGAGAGGFGGFGGGAGGFGGGLGGIVGFGGSVSDEDQVERLKTQIKTLEERIAFFKATLSADQLKRIAQIEVQQMGMAAFSNAKITTELKITDEQKDKIKTVNDEFAKENADLLKEYGMGGGGGRPMGGGGGGGAAARPDPEKVAEYGKKAKALREEAVEKIEKALAADQKKVWKEMIGTSFDLSKLTVRPMTDN